MFWRRSKLIPRELTCVEIPGTDWFWRSLRVRLILDEVGREFDEITFYFPRRDS